MINHLSLSVWVSRYEGDHERNYIRIWLALWLNARDDEQEIVVSSLADADIVFCFKIIGLVRFFGSLIACRESIDQRNIQVNMIS